MNSESRDLFNFWK